MLLNSLCVILFTACPVHMEEVRTRVVLEEYSVLNVSRGICQGTYAGTLVACRRAVQTSPVITLATMTRGIINTSKRCAARACIAYTVITHLDQTIYSKRFSISVVQLNIEEMVMVFDIIGVDAAIANSIRRVLIAEVMLRAVF